MSNECTTPCGWSRDSCVIHKDEVEKKILEGLNIGLTNGAF